MTSGGNNCNDFPENQLTTNTVWTIKASPGGGATTLGGGTAISGGGTPDTGCGTPFQPEHIATKFQRLHLCFGVKHLMVVLQISWDVDVH